MKNFIPKIFFKNYYHLKCYGTLNILNTKISNFYFNKNISINYNDKLFQELFELKDKSSYIAAALISKDISELNSIDNYKENFPFTVNIILFFLEDVFKSIKNN